MLKNANKMPARAGRWGLGAGGQVPGAGDWALGTGQRAEEQLQRCRVQTSGGDGGGRHSDMGVFNPTKPCA